MFFKIIIPVRKCIEEYDVAKIIPVKIIIQGCMKRRIESNESSLCLKSLNPGIVGTGEKKSLFCCCCKIVLLNGPIW
jgi:hypothetical protein